MGDFDLTDVEKAQIEADCKGICEVSQVEAVVMRPVLIDDGSFDGAAEADFTAVMTIKVELDMEPSSEILEPDCDAIADAAGNLQEQVQAAAAESANKADRLVIMGSNYRVRHVRRFEIAGAETFTRLHLKREYP